MTVSKEMLMAFVDGELDAEAARRVEAAVAKDAALAAYVEEQMKLRTHLDGAFAEVVTAPVPAHLEHMILEARVPRSGTPQVRGSWFARLAGRGSLVWAGIPAGALAAGIVIGLSVGGGNGGPIATRGGVLIAQNALAQALSSQLASEQAETVSTRIGVSFRTTSGSYCRSFSTNGDTETALAGVACRDGGAWRIAALETEPAANPSTFQPAASTMPAGLRAAITGMIAGAPLDAAGEREARDRGWSAP